MAGAAPVEDPTPGVPDPTLLSMEEECSRVVNRLLSKPPITLSSGRKLYHYFLQYEMPYYVQIDQETMEPPRGHQSLRDELPIGYRDWPNTIFNQLLHASPYMHQRREVLDHRLDDNTGSLDVYQVYVPPKKLQSPWGQVTKEVYEGAFLITGKRRTPPFWIIPKMASWEPTWKGSVKETNLQPINTRPEEDDEPRVTEIPEDIRRQLDMDANTSGKKNQRTLPTLRIAPMIRPEENRSEQANPTIQRNQELPNVTFGDLIEVDEGIGEEASEVPRNTRPRQRRRLPTFQQNAERRRRRRRRRRQEEQRHERATNQPPADQEVIDVDAAPTPPNQEVIDVDEMMPDHVIEYEELMNSDGETEGTVTLRRTTDQDPWEEEQTLEDLPIVNTPSPTISELIESGYRPASPIYERETPEHSPTTDHSSPAEESSQEMSTQWISDDN